MPDNASLPVNLLCKIFDSLFQFLCHLCIVSRNAAANRPDQRSFMFVNIQQRQLLLRMFMIMVVMIVFRLLAVLVLMVVMIVFRLLAVFVLMVAMVLSRLPAVFVFIDMVILTDMLFHPPAPFFLTLRFPVRSGSSLLSHSSVFSKRSA
jgi:hypothetical protein